MWRATIAANARSEEHTSELQSRRDLVCRLLLEKQKKKIKWWAMDTGSCDHSMNTSIRTMRPDLAAQFTKLKGKTPGEFFGTFEYFFFNATATTDIYTLSLHDALPI